MTLDEAVASAGGCHRYVSRRCWAHHPNPYRISYLGLSVVYVVCRNPFGRIRPWVPKKDDAVATDWYVM